MRATTKEPDSRDKVDILASRDDVIVEIVDQVKRRGYFLTHVDPLPAQTLIDLRWAAQVAGRALGRQFRTYASVLGARQPGKVTMVVVPVDVPASVDVRGTNRRRAVVEDLLGLGSAFLGHGSLSA